METTKEDQYLLTLSTVHVATFVPTKLWFSNTNSNYQTWMEQMLCLLESQKLVDLIRIREKNQPQTNNQEEDVIRRTDQLVRGWILGSINDNIITFDLLKLKTSEEVWLELKNRFLMLSNPGSAAAGLMESTKEDQYLLTLSTVNVATFVTTKLWFSNTNSTYQIWKKQMLCLLKSQKLVDFVLNKTQLPPKLTTEGPQTNNQEDIIQRIDQLVTGWILGSINDNIINSDLLKLETSK